VAATQPPAGDHAPPTAPAPQPEAPAQGQPDQPRVWVLLSDKAGDNAQVEAIEQALGWTCQRKTVYMREPYVFGKPRVEASLHHIDAERSDKLEAPWPDLIITIGRRPSMVALWIREQSGGRTKIVLVGKPSGKLDPYELIIVSAEIQLPPLEKVLNITLPLMQVDRAAVDAARVHWRPRLDSLPKPLIGILVGGPTGPFVYNSSVVSRLIATAESIIAETGGTPYLTTSRRTPPGVVKALRERLPAAAHLFEWRPEAADNPYRALLGLAEGLTVTCDSISMMVEVARLERPLAIFPLPLSPIGTLDQIRRSFTRWLFSPGGDAAKDRLRRRLARSAYRLGLLTQTRDFQAFHRFLIDSGLAVAAGEPFRPPRAKVPDDLALVVERIRALVPSSPALAQETVR
jgi:mitochondrial fission protein ELM1